MPSQILCQMVPSVPERDHVDVVAVGGRVGIEQEGRATFVDPVVPAVGVLLAPQSVAGTAREDPQMAGLHRAHRRARGERAAKALPRRPTGAAVGEVPERTVGASYEDVDAVDAPRHRGRAGAARDRADRDPARPTIRCRRRRGTRGGRSAPRAKTSSRPASQEATAGSEVSVPPRLSQGSQSMTIWRCHSALSVPRTNTSSTLASQATEAGPESGGSVWPMLSQP